MDGSSAEPIKAKDDFSPDTYHRCRSPHFFLKDSFVRFDQLAIFIRPGQNHLARHSERGKKKRQTEEEVGRRHQGMDSPGVCQDPEGSGEQGNK